MNYKETIKYFNKNNDYKNVNIIYGDELFLIDKLVNEITNIFVDNNYKDLNLEIIDYEKDISKKIQLSSETLPFFSDYRIVIVKDIDLTKSGISKMNSDIEKLLNYIDNISDSTLLFFISKKEKIFKGKFFKKIDKIGNIININKLSLNEFKSYINKYFENNNIKIDIKTVNFIIERTGYLDKNLDKSLYDINNELKKIVDISKSDKKISLKSVNKVLANSFENNIFKLTDAIGSKDILEASKIQQSIRLGGADEFMVFYMIVRQIRNLLIVKELKRKKLTINEGRERANISRYEYEKILKYIRFWTYKDLRKAVHECYKTEVEFKSKPYDKEIMLELFLNKIMY